MKRKKQASNQTSVKFAFKNIGPVKSAEMELGDLTIIAGRNNTGKSYLTYTLYGFLRGWSSWPRVHRLLAGKAKAPVDWPFLKKIPDVLSKGSASFRVKPTFADQRKWLLREIAGDFSKSGPGAVFSSQEGEFQNASLKIAYDEGDSNCVIPARKVYEVPGLGKLSIHSDAGKVWMELVKAGSQRQAPGAVSALASCYVDFVLGDVLPKPIVLSAERLAISLFYRELDFTKNRLIEVLQEMGNGKDQKHFSPFLFIDRTASRYALPIKHNIDYTRDILDLKGEMSELADSRLFDDIKDMMDGYYKVVGDEIRFISRTRDKDRRFNIPLHIASSSARGLSDLYFFLRHTARRNDLLVIDEPESHLDTVNQIKMARLISRFMKAGMKVLVTTHSDYLIKEINNLIMIHNLTDKEVSKRLGYKHDETIDPASIRAYLSEKGSLSKCTVDDFGIYMPNFDDTIDDINKVSNELTSRIDEKKAK